MLAAGIAPPRPRAITGSRSEWQYVVPVEAIEGLVAAVAAHLPCTYGADGGVAITTCYFDDRERSHLHACLRDGPSDRLRLREYPALAAGGEPSHWIERKRHLGHLTEKDRRRVTAAEAAALLLSPHWTAATFASLSSDLVLAPLEPALLVRYRRQTFAGPDCRITLDRGVSFSAPPPGLALPLCWQALDAARVEPDATFEVKIAGPAPAWVAAVCRRHLAQPASKYVRGSRALQEGIDPDGAPTRR